MKSHYLSVATSNQIFKLFSFFYKALYAITDP